MSTSDKGVDEVLLGLIQKRDEKALESLYERYSRLVYSLALRIVGTTYDAEEITQEVFLKIWKNSQSFDPSKGRVFSWLVAIARRHSIDRTRSKAFKNQGQETSYDMIESEKAQPDGTQCLVASEEIRIIRDTLKNFAEKDRLIIEFAYFEGLTHSQIAERLSLPLGTVKTRLRQGIMELRKRTRDKVLLSHGP